MKTRTNTLRLSIRSLACVKHEPTQCCESRRRDFLSLPGDEKRMNGGRGKGKEESDDGSSGTAREDVEEREAVEALISISAAAWVQH